MNVLFLSKHDVTFGGVAEVMREIAHRLGRQGVKVIVFSCHDSAARESLPEGVKYVHGKLPKPGLSLLWDPVSHLVQFCRTNEIDLIHAHGVYRPGWAAMKIKRRIGTPFVVTSHGDIMLEGSKRMRRGSIRRRCASILAQADAVTNVTSAMEQETMLLRDVSGKAFVIPNGVDWSWWRQPASPAPGDYIFAIGRHDRSKGFDILIKAFHQLQTRRPGLSLVLAGDGPCTEDLRQLAASLGLTVRADVAGNGGAVCFTGRVAGEHKKSLYLGSRLVAFPSQPGFPGECFGIVQIEAMAAGKTLVSSDIVPSRAIVQPGRNGLLVRGDDLTAWVAAIDRLLDDHALRAAMEAANIEDVRRYDWDAITAQYKAVYENVLTKAARQ